MQVFLRAAAAAALAVLLLAAAPVRAQGASADAVWHEVRESEVPRNGRARPIVPARYRAVRLDRGRLAALLAAAPAEAARRAIDSPVQLALPLPDGGYGRFSIVESPVMEAALAARYPQLRTWLGQGVDDPTATVRFDLTPKGFHAQIIGVDGTAFIDPLQQGDLDHYIAYRTRDHHADKRGVCHVTGEPIGKAGGLHRPKLASGATLRTYRLAMAATGEYTAFHGGTKLDAMSAIVTTVNRVNGLYEREASVRMVLVANNDAIVYTNAATDPYANTSGDLNANQSNVDLVIGSANYDVGHLVGTGGGGIAQLRSPCTSSKARGLTGSPAPVGDAFDIDYVAHEMGHQFGGNHTFNGSGVNCAGGNRNGSTAYEPGSGVTIQAYAGICGGDDLQPNSEDYFHRVSLNEILDFTTNLAGSTCGTTSATGNAIPAVNAPATFTIPGRTPFTLTAAGSDGDGDALTYVWEQFDVGVTANAEGVLSDSVATGPMFRGFAPQSEPVRTFPSWRWILDSANVPPQAAPLPGTATPDWFTGEVLPNVSRTLNFRVTVRDNRAGGGGTNEAGTAVVVNNAAGPFAVTAPNTPVSLVAGDPTSVTWDVALSSAPPISTANVRISLSTDGGATFPHELAASTPNDGAESVTLPAGVATAQARIKVEAVGNVFFDVSNANFIITTAANTPPAIAVGNALAVRQGGPTASGVVATVSDAQQAADSLSVSVSQAPPELSVSVQNVGGNVSLSATAACTLVAPTSGNRTYPVLLTVTDSAGGSASASVDVEVSSNRTPTFGAYAALNMTQNSVRFALPADAPADADGNLDEVSISPAVLPGGGSVAIAPDGEVTVTTTAGTALGSTTLTASATDACGALERRSFVVTVAAPQVVLASAGAEVVSGNALIEPNECNQFNLSLRNDGNVTATGVSATLSTATPNVTLTQPTAAFPDIPPGETRGSLTPFEASTGAAATCFGTLALNGSVTYAGAGGSPAAVPASLPIGQPAATNYVFTAAGGATLPNDGVLVAGSQSDDDPVTLTVPAGFSFRIYGTTYAGGTSLRASVNGNLQFRASGGAIDWDNMPLPTAGMDAGGSPNDEFPAAAPTLFLQWDDWRTDPAAGGAGPGAGIYTKLEGTAPNRQWIIEWRGRIRGDGAVTTNNNRAAIVLYENSNRFDYVYVQTGVGAAANGAGSTIGVQAAATGSTFTQYAHDDANLSAGLRLIATLPAAVCSPGGGPCGGQPAGVTVSQSGGSTAATEGGATDTYSLVLNAAPSGDVTIALSPDAQVATSPAASVGFTPSDWSTPKTVTVSAVDDAVAEGAHGGTIAHSASGGGYDGVPIANVSVAVTDDDVAGVTVTQSGGSTAVAEGGATDSYTLVLTSQPTADVTITLTPDAQVSAPASVGFTPADWATPKPVAVTAVDDALFEGTHTGTLQHTASGGGYAGVAIADVVATITDNEGQPIDLAVASLARGTPVAGQRLTWEVLVDNLSAGVDAASADFSFVLPGTLTNVSWTCTGEAGASCPPSGNGAPAHAIALAGGTGVLYVIGADVPAGTALGTPIATTATIAVSAPLVESVPANNVDTTADTVQPIAIFGDGFEP